MPNESASTFRFEVEALEILNAIKSVNLIAQTENYFKVIADLKGLFITFNSALRLA
ncbi:MAG: hypothetical protein K0S32_955 [Bacteroidetes bacterium]|jgi:hypothetical protein|nr:hypothetical protein [Bacteroidota bacterium]